MIKGPWVMGDTYTICDPYLFTIAGERESQQRRSSPFPKVKAHRDHVSAVRVLAAAEKG